MADQQSVFGTTPEDLQALRQAALQQRAMQFAQLTPMQQAQAGMFTAGNQIVGALGGPDPQLARIQQRQSLLQDVNLADPSSLRSAAQKLLQAGDYTGAQALVGRAMEMEKADVERRKEESIIGKNNSDKLTTEQRNAAALADSQGLQRGTPEWNKAYAQSLTQLTSSADKKMAYKEVGTSVDGRVVYMDQNSDTQFVYDQGPDGKLTKVLYTGKVDRTTAHTNVKATAFSSGTVQETEFDKARGKDDAQVLSDMRKQAATSSKAISAIDTMLQKNSNGIYSGPQAQGTMAATNFLQSMGLLSPENTKKLTDSATYDKLAKDLVMQDLGNKLGTGVSNADRQFIEGKIPQLATNPQARTELLTYIRNMHQRQIDIAKKATDYANKNKNLNGFDYGDLYQAPAAPAGGAGWSIRPKQ